jgi:hypothetical protein
MASRNYLSARPRWPVGQRQRWKGIDLLMYGYLHTDQIGRSCVMAEEAEYEGLTRIKPGALPGSATQPRWHRALSDNLG